MGNDKKPDVDTELHEKEGSLRRGWPALLLTVGMIAAAVYAFSPRDYPPFPETRVHADEMIVNDLAQRGSRLIAVGELGHILITDDVDGVWQEAEIESRRSATLTRVHFVADDVAIAVGHSGWILRSQDGGRSWREIRFDQDSADPLLGIAGPFDDKLFAFGSFGQFQVSTDAGRSWRSIEVDFSQASETAGPDESANDPDSEDYDPFAAFASGGGVQAMAEKHFYAMARADNGSLFLAGERGLIARSTDGGKSWTQLDEIYDGSFYGLLALPEGGLLVYGMRGHAFVSYDYGESWRRSDVPTEQSLFGGTVAADGRVVLVGANNTVLVSEDGGQSFSKVTKRGPHGLVSILPLREQVWLTGGEGGVAVQHPMEAGPAAAGGAS